MDEATSQYFEQMESLFAHPAWRIFSDDIQGWMDAISSKWRSIKPEDLKYEQGRYDGLAQVKEHFEMCQALKAQALEHATQLEEELDVQTL